LHRSSYRVRRAMKTKAMKNQKNVFARSSWGG
jgi:hypothetical protein